MLPQMLEDVNQRPQHKDNNDDDPTQPPQMRSRRQRKRLLCGTRSHR